MSRRVERDVLGKVLVDSSAYYGSETERARENFPISGIRVSKEFIKHYAILKRCAALANMRLGRIDAKIGDAIIEACDAVSGGELEDQFVVDVFQAGAGTSTNMNLNEVIANYAIEILGGRRGNYRIVHPNDHVNMSQSTNDTYHTVTRVSAYMEISHLLIPSLNLLRRSLSSRAREFRGVAKLGRTHLQDAVPMTFGQEFSGYAESVGYCIKEMRYALNALLDVPLGGTAIGTGINSPAEFSRIAIKELNRIEHARFKISKNRFAAMQNEYAELICGNSLKDTAITLNKIANDLRILGSGPRAGFGELVLPPVQPGSSIMPGKINPSMAEMLNMVCFQVIGSSNVIDNAANAGQLELNVFMPIIAFNLLFSIRILSNGVRLFANRCIDGIKIDKDKTSENLYASTAIATALTPYIGYSKAAEVAREAYLKRRSVIDICIERKIMDKRSLERILDPKRLTGQKG